MKPSFKSHLRVVVSWFANEKLAVREIIGYYYGTAVYTSVADALNARVNEGRIVVAVTREQFYSPAMRLAEQVSSSDGKLHIFVLVSVRFSRLQFRNAPLPLFRKIVP